jgi:hypothetical protein
MNYEGHPVIGFGETEVVAPAPRSTSSPWPMVLASSVVSAAASWAIEEVVHKVRRTRR